MDEEVSCELAASPEKQNFEAAQQLNRVRRSADSNTESHLYKSLYILAVDFFRGFVRGQYFSNKHDEPGCGSAERKHAIHRHRKPRATSSIIGIINQGRPPPRWGIDTQAGVGNGALSSVDPRLFRNLQKLGKNKNMNK